MCLGTLVSKVDVVCALFASRLWDFVIDEVLLFVYTCSWSDTCGRFDDIVWKCKGGGLSIGISSVEFYVTYSWHASLLA